MNRRHFIHSVTLVTANAALTLSASAAPDGKIGTIEPAEWKKLNQDSGEKVKAVKPDSDKLSDTDQKLMNEIAVGSMMQLQLSEAAAVKASSADVKSFAQAEVEEQTGLTAKLKEIASAKNATLPNAQNPRTDKLVEKLNSKTGAEFDAHYLKESGVDGHKMLEKTMIKIQSKATDKKLKELAVAALPLIKTHLQAAKDEINDEG